MARVLKFALVAGAVLFSAPAFAQSAQVQENVNLRPDASPASTYSGNINLNANPCPNQSWGLNLPVTGAKSASEAHKQVKVQIDAFADDVKRTNGNCPPPPH